MVLPADAGLILQMTPHAMHLDAGITRGRGFDSLMQRSDDFYKGRVLPADAGLIPAAIGA